MFHEIKILICGAFLIPFVHTYSYQFDPNSNYYNYQNYPYKAQILQANCARIYSQPGYQGSVGEFNDGDRLPYWGWYRAFLPKSVQVSPGCALTMDDYYVSSRRSYRESMSWDNGWTYPVQGACCECGGCQGPSALKDVTCARLFEHPYCDGCSGFRLDLKPGDKVAWLGMLDKKMSAVAVRPGCQLISYDEAHFRGHRINYTRGFDHLGGNWNNHISSLECICSSGPYPEPVVITLPTVPTYRPEITLPTVPTPYFPEITLPTVPIQGPYNWYVQTTWYTETTEKIPEPQPYPEYQPYVQSYPIWKEDNSIIEVETTPYPSFEKEREPEPEVYHYGTEASYYVPPEMEKPTRAPETLESSTKQHTLDTTEKPSWSEEDATEEKESNSDESDEDYDTSSKKDIDEDQEETTADSFYDDELLKMKESESDEVTTTTTTRKPTTTTPEPEEEEDDWDKDDDDDDDDNGDSEEEATTTATTTTTTTRTTTTTKPTTRPTTTTTPEPEASVEKDDDEDKWDDWD